MYLFKYVELTDDIEKILKARCIHESAENFPKHGLYMNTENESAIKESVAVLCDFLGDLYTIEANGKIPDNCKYPLATIQTAQNQKQTNTGSLAKFYKLNIGAKLMLMVNLEIQNHLIFGQTGNISYIEFTY